MLIGFLPMMAFTPIDASVFSSARNQMFVTIIALRLGHGVVHGALIKLVAAESQHRSVQPTLLAQPSRARYFLSQGIVVALLWLCCATLQVASSLIFTPVIAHHAGTVSLLSYRIGWVIGVCFLGSLMTLVVALSVAMLVPNAAGALSIYYLAVPLALVLDLTTPFGLWLDPLTPVLALASNVSVKGLVPPILSVLLWVGLLIFAGCRVARRDVS